jgi:hypothetical protein
MILVLHFVGEQPDSQKALWQDAENIKKKIDAKGKLPEEKETQILTEEEFKAYMDSEASKWEEKIHIVAHGNQEVVGHYNGEALGKFLEPYLKKRQNIKKITLLSCNAASFHPKHAQDFNHVLAYQLASYLNGVLPAGRYLEIRGSVGESYTDSGGRNWVVKPGEELPKDKPANLDREQQMIGRIMIKNRGIARPVFALQGGTVYAAQYKNKSLEYRGQFDSQGAFTKYG